MIGKAWAADNRRGMPSRRLSSGKGRVSAAILRYTWALALVVFALALAELVHPLIPHSEGYIFLAAVAASAWLGGRGPGLLAALAAPFILDFFFLPPLYTVGISAEARPYVLPFLLSAVAAGWMSATQKSARNVGVLLDESEAKFRRILANQPDVAWTGDERGRLLYIGLRMEPLTGYSPEELRSGGLKLLLGRVHADDQERVRQAIFGLFAGTAPFDEEFRFQRGDGRWIWLHNRAMGTYEQHGMRCADGVVSDISRRKQAELELQAKTAFLEALTEATPDGVLVVDRTGHRIRENRKFAEMFEFPPALLRTSEDAPLLQHVTQMAKDSDAFLARVQSLYSHPQESSRDEIELKNGTVLDRYSSPVTGEDGQYFGRIWTFRDITERKRREDTLRQLSAAVEQSPVSVVITDREGRISYVNRKFTECTGYSFDEALGRNPSILKSGYSSPQMYRELWSTVLSGREWHGEFRNRRKNGELYWETAVISPIVDAGGSIEHLLAVKEDITERRALEGELRQAQKLEAIGQLAAGIAHEINTPIQFVADNLTFLHDAWATVLGLLDAYSAEVGGSERAPGLEARARLAAAAERSDLPFIREEAPRAIAQSLDGVHRVATIVAAMKEFSHPDRADKTLADLNQMVASTVTIARNEWKYVADVETNFDAALPPVLCYRGDVNQVVLNLLVNAAHAIRDRGPQDAKGRITVRTRACGEFAEVSVADTGVGIPEEVRGHIFEPFFTTREVGSGTGQGLALAYAVVVKKHRGRIWFETETGKGTTFCVHLPIGEPGSEEGRPS